MPLAGPRREEQQDPGTAVGRKGVAFVGIERQQRADAARLRIRARRHADFTIDDSNPRTFLDLVIAELLAGVEPDHHRARAVGGVEDDRIARAGRRVEGEQVPRAHEKLIPARR